MNEQQRFAYENLCYTVVESENIQKFERSQTLGRFQVRTVLKVLAFLGNEMWNAVVFVDGGGGSLRRADLTDGEHAEVNALLASMLEGVGKGELTYLEPGDGESDFEAVRMLSPQERKALPVLDINELFDVRRRQEFALRNPYPMIDKMLTARYTKVVELGGAHFSTIITVGRGDAGPVWNASGCVMDEHKKPYPIFGMPYAFGEFNLKVIHQLLKNVGAGRVEAYKPEKGGTVLVMSRSLSLDEKSRLPQGASKRIDLANFIQRAMNN